MNPLRAATGEPAGTADGTAGKAGEPVAEGGGPADAADRSAGKVGEKADETVDELCFVARALAQTHPMTEAAHRYRQRCHETERSRQPVAEPADWASTALLVGYCLRRAEEQRAGAEPAVKESAAAGLIGTESAGTGPVGAELAGTGAEGGPAGIERAGGGPAGVESAGGAVVEFAGAGSGDLVAAVAAVAESLRAGEAGRVTLLDPGVTVSALDRVIATELDKRQEHLREQLDDAEWSELEDYIAWWTVHGYALRAVEFP